MACPIPPLPLSKEEFERRYAAGARTMRELDPAFAAWAETQKRFQRFQAATIIVGVAGFLFMLLWVLI
jgi:hypothetical protein